MATITLRRSDLFPIGTTVGIYPAGAHRTGQLTPGPPTAAVIASATVDAAGLLTVTDAAIASYTPYVAAAQVSGTWQYARCRSTLDVSDTAMFVGTGDTSNGSPTLSNVAATSGLPAIGMRITGPGIPAGTYLISGSGASWTMGNLNGQTVGATATGTGVALQGEGASPAVTPANAGAGAQAVPVAPTRWQAKTRQRRAISGTF